MKVIAVMLSRCNNTEIELEVPLEQKDYKARKAVFNSKIDMIVLSVATQGPLCSHPGNYPPPRDGGI